MYVLASLSDGLLRIWSVGFERWALYSDNYRGKLAVYTADAAGFLSSAGINFGEGIIEGKFVALT